LQNVQHPQKHFTLHTILEAEYQKKQIHKKPMTDFIAKTVVIYKVQMFNSQSHLVAWKVETI